jgi:hypothetical protein
MLEQDQQNVTDPDNVELRFNILAKHVVQGFCTTFKLKPDLLLPNILGTGVTATSINPVLLDDVAFVPLMRYCTCYWF